MRGKNTNNLLQNDILTLSHCGVLKKEKSTLKHFKYTESNDLTCISSYYYYVAVVIEWKGTGNRKKKEDDEPELFKDKVKGKIELNMKLLSAACYVILA